MAIGGADREWLELVADLVARPLGALPAERIALQLVTTFAGVACSYSTTLPDRSLVGAIYPLTEPLGGHREFVLDWGARYAHRFHPILVHYRGLGAAVPVQVADVPAEHVDRRTLDTWYGMAGEWGCPDQLALPLPGPVAGLRGFVVGRTGAFTATELERARMLGRLLGGLDRHVRAMAGRWPEPAATADARMTPRQLSVLVLLSDGLTAAAIARRLEIGERTVHKHLEHVYAKLGVADRLSAVVRAQNAGLIPVRAVPV
jgi:DNA-binding CsgD family transcriptional regulator